MVVCCSQKVVFRAVDFNVIIKETFSYIIVLDILWKNPKSGISLMAVRKEHRAEIPRLRWFLAANAVQIHACRAGSACAARASLCCVHPFQMSAEAHCLITLGLTQAEPAPVAVAGVAMPSESTGKPLAA